jgi:hypothetical protein
MHRDPAVHNDRYCFGAPYVCNELARDICSAGAFAHPAFLKESHFRRLKSKKLIAYVITVGTDGHSRVSVHVLRGDRPHFWN